MAGWLCDYMFKNRANRDQKAAAVAAHFNDAGIHKNHGCRIDRKEAASQDLVVEDLEVNQTLQDEVLTPYHVSTLILEKTPAAKLVTSNAGRTMPLDQYR